MSIPAQAGAVPVSLALWLHRAALLPGREQPGERCEDCPGHSALFPQDMMGEVLMELCAHGARAGCAVLRTPGGPVQR